MQLADLYFWQYKTPQDNAWRPIPGHDPIQRASSLPPWARRIDIEAAIPDLGPFIAGAGALAYLKQLPHLGWTVPVNPFKNVGTMKAMHRTTLFLTPLVFILQSMNKDYRQFVPRWNHGREHRRDESSVRKQIDGGMACGLGLWAVRMFMFGGINRTLWAPTDMILGGALTDLLDREYVKAHNL